MSDTFTRFPNNISQTVNVLVLLTQSSSKTTVHKLFFEQNGDHEIVTFQCNVGGKIEGSNCGSQGPLFELKDFHLDLNK